MSIRLLVVDDHPLVRSGLRALLERQPDMTVVGEAGDGVEAVAEAERLQPDVVLMDLRMPRLHGVGAARQLARLDHPPKVLIVTMFDLDEDVVEAVRAGVRGYVLKGGSVERLIEAIRTVAEGGAALSPAVMSQLLDHASTALPPLPPPDALEHLSEREKDVLHLLAAGLSNAEIADCLEIGEGSVKTYVSNLLTKLKLRDRLQAVVYAYRNGLVGTRQIPSCSKDGDG